MTDPDVIHSEPIEDRTDFPDMLPKDLLEPYYIPVISLEDAKRIVHSSWAGHADKTVLGLFPVWEIDLQQGKKLKTIYVDGIIGYPYQRDPIPEGSKIHRPDT